MEFSIHTTDTAATISTYGAEMLSFSYRGTEYLWYGDPTFWGERAPILFPTVSVAKNNVMSHDGVEYPMPMHGFARHKAFEPILQTPDKVAFALKEDSDTLTMYPFRFRLVAEYTVTEGGFSAMFTTENCDEKPMTYCIGGHPGFRCPLYDEDVFSDYQLQFSDVQGASLIGTKKESLTPDFPYLKKLEGNILPLSYEVFENDTLMFENLPSSLVKYVSTKTGHGIAFDFIGFQALAVWTRCDLEAPFVCLEPWNGMPPSPEETTEARSKKYARTLQPGQSHTVGYKVTVL